MKRILNLIEKGIVKNTVQSMTSIVEYKQKESSRAVYIDGGVYEENKISLIFLVNTGDWFNKTIRFDIAVNTYDNKLVTRQGYGCDYKVFDRAEFKEIINCISNEVHKFSLQDTCKKEKKLIKKIG